MAATSPRATSPHVEPFPTLDSGIRAPSSLPPASTSVIAPIHPTTTDPKQNLSPHALPYSVAATAAQSPKLGGLTRSPRVSPVPLTGQAAMADLKRRAQQQQAAAASPQTSPNPAAAAIQAMMGGGGISRPSDAPAMKALDDPSRKAAEKITTADMPSQEGAGSLQASPTSLTSFGTAESGGASGALTSTAGSTTSNGLPFVAEPAQMVEGGSYSSSNNNGHRSDGRGEDENKAFSYPGPMHQASDDSGPSRGMSLPGFGQESPRSPPPSSGKRHKCPYCATDFTRHHNLKSHLLTHSQEKPYVCSTCSARFRRLHDLKRHSKLHTGEKPHICDKCLRSFARGDALARHNKGPGGCAGRRTSFNGEDGAGDESMDGIEYTGGGGDDEQPEESPRRVSEPSRKRAHVDTGDDAIRDVYRQHSSTYPPPVRPHASSISSNMGPPQVIHPGSHSVTSPREPGQPNLGSGAPYYTGAGQVLDQRSIIESPKPLSPGQPPDAHRLSVGDVSMSSVRNRSPSLTTQFQQQHFGRGSGGRTPPQPLAAYTSGPPVLPPLQHTSQLGQPRGGGTGSGSGPAPLSATSLPSQQTSNPSSLSSHGRGSGSGHSIADGAAGGDIWGYVRSLEQRFSRMQDEYELRISRLQEEVISLKGQVSAAAASQYANNQAHEQMGGSLSRY